MVLGGGGLKGLAHVGAWRALTEAGFEPHGIVGTSIGALVGSLISAGSGWEEMRDSAATLEKDDIVRLYRRALLINGIRQSAVFRGDTLREYFEGLLPEAGWDALEIPTQINAVDVGSGQTEWFGPGARTDVPLLDAVYASAALPVLYPPALIGESAYVDGGTEHPLALGRAAEMGATGVVAIDVGGGEDADSREVVSQGMIAMHQRIFGIMTYRRRRDVLSRWDGPPLLYVRPRLDGYGTFDFEHTNYFVEEGYRATREVLETGGVATRT